MNKNLKYYSDYSKNDNDKFWKVYRYFESISYRENSALQELLDFTIKNKHTHKNKKSFY